MARISVIIPFHNTEKREFEECLFSVINQKFEDFEVLCIDDNSTSKDTIDTSIMFEQMYPGIFKRIVLKENVGAAEARNIGLEKSKGIYCIFLDSDDVFDCNLLGELYKAIIENDSDVAICGCTIFENKDKEIIEKKCRIKGNYEAVIGKDMMLNYIPASGWNRLCKKSFLLKNEIRFQTLKSDNDLFFSLMTVLCTKNIVLVDNCDLIRYRFMTGHQISTNIDPLNLLEAIDYVLEKAKKKVVYDNYYEMVVSYLVNTGIYEINTTRYNKNAQTFYEEVKRRLLKENIVIKDYRIQQYIFLWETKEYASGWFKVIGDYEKQLELHTKELLIVLDSNEIYLWGRGARGKAFEKWAMDHSIVISGVCDKRNNDIGLRDYWKNRVVHTEDALKNAQLLIASNNEIYKNLCMISNKRIINLETYSPL